LGEAFRGAQLEQLRLLPARDVERVPVVGVGSNRKLLPLAAGVQPMEDVVEYLGVRLCRGFISYGALSPFHCKSLNQFHDKMQSDRTLRWPILQSVKRPVH